VACVLKDSVGGVRVSLRSVGAIDVGPIAMRFGGGGHAFASGFTVPGPIETVLADIRLALAEVRLAMGES
jgi:phosphoesterase RecJ-like protein